MKLHNKVNKIIEGYGDKKPSVSYGSTGGNTIIILEGGHYQARQDVEDYFAKRNLLDEVSNSTTSKKICIPDK